MVNKNWFQQSFEDNKIQNTKRYVSTTKYIYYHIGVKMDNMFRPSSGHHQVQYKEMWSSTELSTRMG